MKTFDSEKEEKNLKNENKTEKNGTPMLDMFGRDLTQLASEKKLDLVFGREKEMEEIVQVLNKRKKNNPLLIGEPGVGKTAIIEGLAIKMQKKEADVWLNGKRLIEINMTSMVSGTKYRGEFEQRMESLIKEIESNTDVIVFFDEIHNV
ncbi:MAG: AAA family ATPase, partial [Candidatus Izemoplasmatales bacterium]